MADRQPFFAFIWWLFFAVIVTICAPKSIEQSRQVADQLSASGRLISHQLMRENYSIHYMASCDIQPDRQERVNCDQHAQVNKILVFFHGTPGSWSI